MVDLLLNSYAMQHFHFSRYCIQTILTVGVSLLLACVDVGNAYGREKVFSAGIHMGIGMSSFQPVAKNPRDYYYSPVPTAGILARYSLGEVISINAELNYISIRTQRDGMLQFVGTPLSGRFPQSCYGYFSERIRADYLELPLMIDGTIGDRLRLYCGAGFFVAARLSAMNSTAGRSYIYADSAGAITEPISAYQVQDLNSNMNITGRIRPVNFGGTGHIGMSRSVRGSRLGVDARCSFGFADIWMRCDRPGVNKTLLLAIRAVYTMPFRSNHAQRH